MVNNLLSERPTLLIIAGPTAVGKTCVAFDIAKYYNTSIISADSRQFYSEIPIGTAAPSAELLSEVKHHFVGQLKLSDYYNVSIYEKQVLNLLDELFQNNKVVVLTGGSGLYIKAVCEGIDDLPDADESIRNSLQEEYEHEGIGALRSKLLKLDPDYAMQVDMANHKRILRALEVIIQTGTPYSKLRKNDPVLRNFNIIKIALNLPRAILHERINSRVDQMISEGLINEAQSNYPNRNLNALNTVGYKELFEYFDGNISLEQAIEKIKTNTRRYARRQITWFKKDSEMHWFEPDTENIIDWLKKILSKD